MIARFGAVGPHAECPRPARSSRR